MYHANFPPSADFFCLAKRQYFSCGLLRVEQKGGHTIEMATDDPTPTASHQELSGSNTGHFTVTYDSEDANYCARVDELVRAIESMPFVNQLGQLGGELVQNHLRCITSSWHLFVLFLHVFGNSRSLLHEALEVLVCIMLACTWCGAWMSRQSFW